MITPSQPSDECDRQERELNEFRQNRTLPVAALWCLALLLFMALASAALSSAYDRATAPHPDLISSPKG